MKLKLFLDNVLTTFSPKLFSGIVSAYKMRTLVRNGMKIILDADACSYSCFGEWDSVCGSDRGFYSKMCGLHRNSCREKKAIVYVKHAKSLEDCWGMYLCINVFVSH